MEQRDNAVNYGHLAMTLGIMALIGWMLYESFGFPARVRLFPVVITVFVLALCAIDLVRIFKPALDRRRGVAEPVRASGADQGGPPKAESEDDPWGLGAGEQQEEATTTLKSIGWLFVLVIPTLLVGFMIAFPIYMLLFLRIQGGYSWIRIALVIGGTWAVLYFVFAGVLNLPVYSGWLL